MMSHLATDLTHFEFWVYPRGSLRLLAYTHWGHSGALGHPLPYWQHFVHHLGEQWQMLYRIRIPISVLLLEGTNPVVRRIAYLDLMQLE